MNHELAKLLVLHIWPHSRCNCRCLMCDIWMNRRKQEIATVDFARWLETAGELLPKRILLTGGEALLHSDLWEICRLLKSHHVRVLLMSTGLTLERHAEEVVRWCDGLRLSLDGPLEVHNQVRGIPHAYERLERGVQRVRELAPRFQVFGRCAVHRANFGSLRRLVQAAHELSLDRVSFTATDISSEAYNRPGVWNEDRRRTVALTAADLRQLAEELDALEQECADDFASGFIGDQPKRLRQKLLGYYGALHGQNPFPTHGCDAPWTSAVVEFDGTVRPCFYQPAYGNLYEAGGLAEVLNSPQAVRFRRELDVATNPICQRCVCPGERRDSLGVSEELGRD